MMAKPFDATTKQIVELNPQDWLELIGLARFAAHLVDADLSAVTTDADRVLKITDAPERLLHFEFESGHDASGVPRRLHRYNVLLNSLYDLPVATVVFLLNPRAGCISDVNGLYERSHPDAGDVAKFWYRAVRVWEIPVADLLAQGVATLPLALLSDLGTTDASHVVSAMHQRIVADAESEDHAETVLTGAYLFAGLRFSDTIVQTLFKGILNMEESSTYQAILMQGEARGVNKGINLGRAEEARRMIVLFGENRFGVPPAQITAALESIAAQDKLEELAKRLPQVASWDELLTVSTTE